MDDRERMIERYQRHREMFLVVLLIVLMGGGLLLFLIFASGGFFLYVVLIALALGLFGYLHYLLWGRGFSRIVRKEREEYLEQQREEEWESAQSSQPPWERRN